MAVVALALLAAGLARAGEVFTFEVPLATNLDMDPAMLQRLLGGPEVQVVPFYEPQLAIPGWTGRFGYCSPRHICIKGNQRQLVLTGDQIRRRPDGLSVDLPRHRWFGLMRYRLGTMLRITFPPFWPGDQAANIDLLDISDARSNATPVIDMHLPAPYVAVGSYRIDPGSKVDQPRPYAVPPCDATLAAVAAGGKPGVHPEHLALVYEAWLRRLADSAWWSDQISGVRHELLAGVPASFATLPGTPRVVRVMVERGGSHVVHLRARVAVLPGTTCPGATQYEFSWVNGALMAASISESPELMGPDQCPAENRVREALWWEGKLASYTGPRAGNGEAMQWNQWRVEHPECRGDMPVEMPDVSAVQQAAEEWQHYAQGATVLPPESDSK
jgi:hypothetical protein